jgi:hypothetical protein
MKKFCLALFFLMFSATLLAQEENSQPEAETVQVTEAWYASPWLWVGGAALIIILLVVISNRKESRE